MTSLAAKEILARAGEGARPFARNDLVHSPTLDRFVSGIAQAMTNAGYEQLDRPGPDTNVVLHAVDADAPRPLPAQGGAHIRHRDRRAS
jgi:hypothetical protein